MGDESIVRHDGSTASALAKPKVISAAPVETVPVDEPTELLAYWRILRKRRWAILTTFFVVFTGVVIATLKQTPIYRATVLLEVEKENPDILTVQQLFEIEAVTDAYLESQYKILESESLARRVIGRLGLDKLEEFTPAKPWWSFGTEKPKPPQNGFVVSGAIAEPSSGSYQDLLPRYYERMSVEPVRRSRLVKISFESKDPELAARAANTLASDYIERTLEVRWEVAQRASEWLSQQLLGLKGKLEKSENELQKYARGNGLLFLETDKGKSENIVNERFRQLQEGLTQAQTARYEKESLNQLVQAGDYGSIPGVFEDKLIQDLTARLAVLRQEHANLLTTFSAEYPKVKEIQNQINEIDAALGRERERAAQRIARDYQAAVQREKLLGQALQDQQKQADAIAEKSVQYNILRREVETNRQMYESLLQKLKEAGVSSGLRAGNSRIVDTAQPPRKPVRPRIALNLALGLVFGLGLGLGAAFLLEHLDNTLKTTDEAERFLQLPALALIPVANGSNGNGGMLQRAYHRGRLLAGGNSHSNGGAPARWHRIDANGREHSTFSESFRSLRTSLLLSTAERPPRSMLITSAQPGEGKTMVATNLAISLTQLGQRVLLIDGDMRRPCLHQVFELNRGGGLVAYLTGQSEWMAAVVPTTYPGLDVLMSGPVPPNPAELLSSERMRRLLYETSAAYDFVVLDSPPLINLADARIIASLVDGVVLVLKGGATTRDMARRARQLASAVGANVLGLVLNRLDSSFGDYHYYQGDYPPEPPEGRPEEVDKA